LNPGGSIQRNRNTQRVYEPEPTVVMAFDMLLGGLVLGGESARRGATHSSSSYVVKARPSAAIQRFADKVRD
jgi:hypothetical protein